jgi:hypothetical protein
MTFPFDPSPSTLWTLHRDGKAAMCELLFVPLGNEVRMLRNGSLLMSRIFESGNAIRKANGLDVTLSQFF